MDTCCGAFHELLILYFNKYNFWFWFLLKFEFYSLSIPRNPWKLVPYKIKWFHSSHLKILVSKIKVLKYSKWLIYIKKFKTFMKDKLEIFQNRYKNSIWFTWSNWTIKLSQAEYVYVMYKQFERWKSYCFIQQRYFVFPAKLLLADISCCCFQEQDEELSRLRIELGTLREQENGMEQKVETGKTQLEQLSKSHKDVLLQVSQVHASYC